MRPDDAKERPGDRLSTEEMLGRLDAHTPFDPDTGEKLDPGINPGELLLREDTGYYRTSIVRKRYSLREEEEKDRKDEEVAAAIRDELDGDDDPPTFSAIIDKTLSLAENAFGLRPRALRDCFQRHAAAPADTPPKTAVLEGGITSDLTPREDFAMAASGTVVSPQSPAAAPNQKPTSAPGYA